VSSSLLRLVAFFLSIVCWAGAGQAAAIVVVSSESSTSYVATVDALLSELERSGVPRADVVLRNASDLGGADIAEPTPPRLFIALGTEALKQVLGREVRAPVIAALIPRIGFERVTKEFGKKTPTSVTAVYLDQPLGRQLDLLRLAMPDAKRVGVLWGPESASLQPTLASVLQLRGLQEVGGQVGAGGALFSGLKAALDNADVLLALPDSYVYNSATVANILFATYRARVPVLAFSPSYVKAGALMSLHTTSVQVGVQTAAMVRSWLHSGILPPPLYPIDFSVTVNEHVARSLGLKLDGAALADRLHRLETLP